MKLIIKIIITCCLVFFIAIAFFWLFWEFFFFPNDYTLTRFEATLPSNSKSEKIDINFLDLLPKMQIIGNISPRYIEKLFKDIKSQNILIKREAYTKERNAHFHVRVGTGYPGIWVDERSSLLVPMNTEMYFSVSIKKGSVLELSAISLLSDGELEVVIKDGRNRSEVRKFHISQYIQKFNAADVKLRYNNRGYPRAKDDIGWRKHCLDLTKYEGQNITIGFVNKGNSAIALANPVIFIPAEKRRYNVIYIVFDGVSTRLWSMYNPESNLTPFMKQKADEEFIVFENMFSLGDKTRISTVGLFCSIFPFLSRHGINRNFIPEYEIDHFYDAVNAGRFLPLPELFRRNGYISRQFGNSGFTVQLLGTGVDYGFDASYEFSYNPYDTYGITTRFFQFLRENSGREFFVYLHYNTPHKPFYAPILYYFKGIFDSPLASLWRPDFMGCISYTDDVFKNLFEAFRANGLLENTIIVVATDHGSGFDLSKFDAGFQYADYTRMMCMLYLPPSLRKEYNVNKKRIRTYISQLNIAPTLAEFVGIKVPHQFLGRSFIKVLQESYKEHMFDDEIWSFGRKTFSVIDKNLYKYILTFDESRRFVNRKWAFFGEEREVPFELLYDLKSDPFEMKNLSGIRKEIIKQFRYKVLQRDFHHPEKNVISFYPSPSNNVTKVDVVVQANSPLLFAKLYQNALNEVEGLTIRQNGNEHKFSFFVGKDIKHLVFEHHDDRVPVSISIYVNNKLYPRKYIFASPLMVNILNNPFKIQRREDFLFLSSNTIPYEEKLISADKELKVIVSRIDLHRWIDIGIIEEKALTAGMKQTLKSWGYIQ